MKPIIIIKETNKDGKFELTEKELKELIEQAYKQGFSEGKASASVQTWGVVGGTINGGQDNGTVTLPYVHPVYKGEPNLGEWEIAKPYNPVVYGDWLNKTSGKPNPAVTLNGSAVSTGV